MFDFSHKSGHVSRHVGPSHLQVAEGKPPHRLHAGLHLHHEPAQCGAGVELHHGVEGLWWVGSWGGKEWKINGIPMSFKWSKTSKYPEEKYKNWKLSFDPLDMDGYGNLHVKIFNEVFPYSFFLKSIFLRSMELQKQDFNLRSSTQSDDSLLPFIRRWPIWFPQKAVWELPPNIWR